MPPDTVAGLLQEGRGRLAAAGIDTAALDARILLQEAAGLRHEDIIGDPQRVIEDAAVIRFKAMLERRTRREPVSRIVGEREFFGRCFRVTPATLDPRPDTEILVEQALRLLDPGRPAGVLDLGTGTGAIIISILAERPLVTGMGVDLSRAALDVAQENAGRHGVLPRLVLHQGNWFDGVSGRFDLIVANPPYIAHGGIESLAPEVKDHDPHLALSGGADGLEAYRRIAGGAARHLAPQGSILVESARQEGDVEQILANAGFKCVGRFQDLSGTLRTLAFRQ